MPYILIVYYLYTMKCAIMNISVGGGMGGGGGGGHAPTTFYVGDQCPHKIYSSRCIIQVSDQ